MEKIFDKTFKEMLKDSGVKGNPEPQPILDGTSGYDYDNYENDYDNYNFPLEIHPLDDNTNYDINYDEFTDLVSGILDNYPGNPDIINF